MHTIKPMLATFSPNVVEQKTPKNIKWLSPTGETTWVVSRGGGRFLLSCNQSHPQAGMARSCQRSFFEENYEIQWAIYVQQGLCTMTRVNFHGFVEVS
jgi:hypothetical protein